MKILKEVIPYVIIVLLVILIRAFLVSPAIVKGDSMKSTLVDGEVVILNKVVLKINGIARYDIVVVDSNTELLIKRVIGLPNENIEYKNNKLYINGIESPSQIKFEDTKDFVYETKDNEYFVLGDNRSLSKDSRSFGGVKENQIKGKVNLVIFPFTKMGLVK